MLSFSRISAAALAASLFAASAAQAATTATGGASATVIGPLSIVQSTALNFGSFSSGATSGTIDSFGFVTGGVTSLALGSPAIFNVTGNPNTNFSITGPASVVLSSGLNTMTATLTVPTGSSLDTAGNRAFNVTGVLGVAANQAPGSYTGSYNVSVNY